VPGNPKDSRWYATPRQQRRKKGLELTLSDDAYLQLAELAEEAGISRSALVERWISTKSKSKRTVTR
jgi:predicted DNA-binding protein YlxM (UPF0122 family)